MRVADLTIGPVEARIDAPAVELAQRFEYRRTLRLAQSYRFTIERFSDPADPDLVSIEADVYDLDGKLAAIFAATFRIVALTQEARS
jgi:hypothetical protein